ncbi:radical SAM protein [Oscillochloris sp. ZM17-4]|uniref:CUAEP/CCAEP-tail radical SAM (seleno)protein n=1 Tax=Oscillochloris sp. ZM17-4 TaxID=2866714 RepID=UPI001C73B016|nr:CUAEP/CCAEP-tail radical SAM protein [Oscillochloris sp. ZM17-4]MBX0328740.1 radical SAM protein [Oscillochloris sp. ZM17-4]
MPLALLISTYELGHQPFGLASPAAWLRRAGAEVLAIDTSLQPLDRAAAARAALIGLYVPMHTATRLAAELLPELRALAPQATIVCYGLYAPLNADHLRALGADACVGGEFEAALVDIYKGRGATAADESSADESRRAVTPLLSFIPPDRAGLPGPLAYAALITAEGRRAAGYTEASRGCKHTCRHCPIVPVYGGRFRTVPRDVVLEDVRRQVAAGAAHITFGDPDFLNGPGHAMKIVRALHAEHPGITYDVTIKVEHLLRHAELLPELRDTGCALVTSAVEALDEGILERLDKRHTRDDVARAAGLLREAGVGLNATFVAFTPWTSRQVYADFLRAITELGLVESVSPVQYAIRLLIPSGSWLLHLDEVRDLVGPFDPAGLVYPWRHPDPAMDTLQRAALRLAQGSGPRGETRAQFFEKLWDLVDSQIGAGARPSLAHLLPRPPIPYLSEPWYC